MTYTIFDIETDGLIETVSLIHCLSYQIIDETGFCIEEGSLIDNNSIKEFILKQEILIGHNIIKYDIPVLEKLLSIKIKARLVDTLGLSWYLYPMRIKHGLELWGTELGVPKPTITDWENLTIEEYVFRCESDVKINTLLYLKEMDYLKLIYKDELYQIDNLINYLSFKLDCAREQEEVGCKLNISLVDTSLAELNQLKEDKMRNLIAAMPRDIKFKEVNLPSKLRKADGSISVRGQKWYDLLQEKSLPLDYEGTVMVQISDSPGNPGSSIQIKNWLTSLGWEPRTFEFRKNKAGDIKKVPQIYVYDEVCDSIKLLYDIEPALENLDMLSLIKHRIGIFESFKNSVNSANKTKAQVHGFTNTLRFKHKKPIVNLPKVSKFYGEQIRGAIITPHPDYLLCGSDMSSLEDSTKQHYMFFFDPDYVTQMRVPGFDPHLDIALLAGMLTEQQIEEHKTYSKTKGLEGIDHSVVRGKAKTVNFAGIYGAGPPKIAQSTGMPLKQAETLHKTYWDRNKAVKQVSNSCRVTTIRDGNNVQMWQKNPVSGFWYTLRYKKDKFSTLNQGTGVFCFDLWVREVRKRGIKVILQYHDEIVFAYPKGKEEEVNKALTDSIETVNNIVKLNVPLGISIEFGENYAKIH